MDTKQIILFGDSHTDIFLNYPGVVRFDVSKCELPPITLARFNNCLDLAPVVDFFKTTPSDLMVISVGEIDIRAHAWRHIPRLVSQGFSTSKWIEDLAQSYIDSIITLHKRYQIKRTVIWTSPPAGERGPYNEHWPFVGPLLLRNYLLDQFYRSLIKLCETCGFDIQLSTAFYDWINTDTFITLPDIPSHDGVHWHPSTAGYFWNNYVLLGIFNKENYDRMQSKELITYRCDSDTNQLYDTWARTSELNPSIDIQHTVDLLNDSWSLILNSQRSKIFGPYQELGIKLIR